jgi:tRNA(fMet)-specific endonuclease VapC
VLHLDTTFLIDLERETSRDQPGPALEFLEALDPSEVLAVSVHVLSELRAGAELTRKVLETHEALDRLVSGLLVVYPDDRFAAAYARVFAALRRTKRDIATMDLLIATAATLDDAPLVTRNVRDFSRVPGLRVLRY